jgi:hypothetical protein
VAFLTRSLEEERSTHQREVVSLTEELNCLRRERQTQESECRALRKEKDCWQQSAEQSVEQSEGMKVHDHVVTTALHSLRTRLNYLAAEARSCRLLEESGLYSAAQEGSKSSSMSVDTSKLTPCGTVDSSLQETLAALLELENELIPIVSRLHASFTRTSAAPAPSSSLISEADKLMAAAHAPKISLSSFEENDLALFFPTPKGDYLAFNCGAPHHYLSAESKALIGRSHQSSPSLTPPQARTSTSARSMCWGRSSSKRSGWPPRETRPSTSPQGSNITKSA